MKDGPVLRIYDNLAGEGEGGVFDRVINIRLVEVN